MLFQHQPGVRRHAGFRGEHGCGTQHEIVGFTGQRRCKRAADGQRQVRRVAGVQHVAAIGEGHEAIEQVVAVRTATGDMQEEVELRGGERVQPGVGRKPGVAWKPGVAQEQTSPDATDDR